MGYLVALIAILVFWASLLFAYFRNREAMRKEAPSVAFGLQLCNFIGFPLIVGTVTVCNALTQIPAGNVGLVYTFGAITSQRSEGLQWVAPWQSVVDASVQTQGYKFEGMPSFSSETQQVTVTATLNVRVLPVGIQKLFRDVGKDYFNVLIRPRVLQAFKDETVKYSSIDIAPQRETIRAAVRDRLKTELEDKSILVEDLLIDDIAFGDRFEAAIEEKQTQSQLALAEKEKVQAEKAKADQQLEKARGEAGSVLIMAEKQAEANKKLSESISPTYIQYLFASKLSPNVKVMMIPNGQNFILDTPDLKDSE